jgi:hypothetical protein
MVSSPIGDWVQRGSIEIYPTPTSRLAIDSSLSSSHNAWNHLVLPREYPNPGHDKPVERGR